MDNPFYIQQTNIPDAIFRGISQGDAMAKMQLAPVEQQKALEQQKQYQAQMAADFSNLANNPNATGKDYAAVMLRYPQHLEPIQKSFEMLSGAQKDSLTSHVLEVDAAMQSGRPDIATALLKRQAEAYRNSGQEEKARGAETTAKIIEIDPNVGRLQTSSAAAALMGADKYKNVVESRGMAEQQPFETKKKEVEANFLESEKAANIGKTYADTDKIYADMDESAARLGLDAEKVKAEYDTKMAELRGKARTDAKISGEAEKLINESASNYITGKGSAAKMLDLAGRLQDRSNQDLFNTSGGFSTVAEVAKKSAGMRDEITRMRNEAAGIITPAMLANYKKVSSGQTSDRDIETAQKGAPPENASIEELANYLRAAAKIQAANAEIDNAKAKWVSDVGHLGKAKDDVMIDGIAVPAGTSFNDYVDKYLAPAARKSRAGDDYISGRSYYRHR